jgi:threonine/homoserine/homoserine lactone efflux protein
VRLVSGLAAFVAVAAVVIATPGQDTALTVRNSLSGGRRGGLATALGVSTGQLVWALATSAGLAAIVVASEPVFRVLQLLGAAYLVYLGGQALARALGREEAPHVRRAGERGRGAAFRQGVLSNLGNPKMAVFFTTLLPQFAAVGGGGSFAPMLGLGVLFCAMTLVWLSAYAVAVDRASRVLRRPAVRRALDAVTGLVLGVLGLRLAAEPR